MEESDNNPKDVRLTRTETSVAIRYVSVVCVTIGLLAMLISATFRDNIWFVTLIVMAVFLEKLNANDNSTVQI